MGNQLGLIRFDDFEEPFNPLGRKEINQRSYTIRVNCDPGEGGYFNLLVYT